MDINKNAFESWLRTHYILSESTYPTIISDSFLIFRENLGISIEELVDGKKSLFDYKNCVHSWLLKDNKTVGQRPSEYTSHIKYLIEYIRGSNHKMEHINDFCNIDKKEFESWLRDNYNFKEPTFKTIMSTSFFVCRYDLGISLDDLIHKHKSIDDFKQAVQAWLDKNPNNHASKPNDYVYHLKYLLKYLGVFDIIEKNKDTKIIKQPLNKIDNDKILKPSFTVVQNYLNKWDSLENYVMQEKALNNLFHHTFPHNNQIDQLLIKIATLNDFYSTNIFNVYAVAKHYASLNIDARLQMNDLSLVDDLSCIPNMKSRIYSFATKYCSHHNHDDYPIYDSYVEKMLIYFRNKYHFYEFDREDLKVFSKFKDIILKFRTVFELNHFSIKDIDKYLWQAGKEYFPNWKKKKSTI